jgi:hypothetical protein
MIQTEIRVIPAQAGIQGVAHLHEGSPSIPFPSSSKLSLRAILHAKTGEGAAISAFF